MDSKFHLSTNFCFAPVCQMLACSNFEWTSSGDDTLIFNSVLDSSETISNSIFGLSNWVVIRSLDQDSAWERVSNTFNESVLLFTKSLLVNVIGPTEVFFSNIIYWVELFSTTGKRNSLSISLFGTTDSDNSSIGEKFKRRRVNSLLVNNDKVFVGSFTELLFEFDDLNNFIVGELSFGGNKFLSLIGWRPEKAGVDFGLFVLQGDVQAHDVAVV